MNENDMANLQWVLDMAHKTQQLCMQLVAQQAQQQQSQQSMAQEIIALRLFCYALAQTHPTLETVLEQYLQKMDWAADRLEPHQILSLREQMNGICADILFLKNQKNQGA